MNRARGYHSGVLMADGRLLVSGGFAGPGVPDWSDAEIYNPRTGTWTLAGNTSLPRHNHETASLSTGEVVIFGGSNCLTGGAHSGIEYYDPETNEWQHSNLVMLGLKWMVASPLHDGSVLISGGKTCGIATAESFIYHPPEQKEEDDSGFLPGFGTIPAVSALLCALSLRRRRESGELKRRIKKSGVHE